MKLRSCKKQPYWALHTAGSADVKVQNIFNMGNNMTCSTDCTYRTAAKLYMYRRNVVCFRNITVNTLYKGDNTRGGGGCGGHYYNDKTVLNFS